MNKRWINLWRAGRILSNKEIRVVNGERRLYEKLRRCTEMIKVKSLNCPWCHRTVHAILRNGQWVAECSVCADEFVVGELCTTMKHYDTMEGGDNNE